MFLRPDGLPMILTSQQKEQLYLAADEAANLLKVIGNKNRLLILCLLLEYHELSVSELLDKVTLSQSALSQHLAKMRQEQLIHFRRQAQVLYYHISDSKVEKIIAVLKTIYCP